MILQIILKFFIDFLEIFLFVYTWLSKNKAFRRFRQKLIALFSLSCYIYPMKHKLTDIADVIRSKNSGPYELTFDIIFKDFDMYKKVAQAKVFNISMFAELYGIDESTVMEIINFDPAKAIKITIERPICSGNLGETDVYGAQQHTPLLGLEFYME